jgi:hypothetical protein
MGNLSTEIGNHEIDVFVETFERSLADLDDQ